ncbi:MAG TPA: dienelactone hydrolase family protein [Candidatus Binatia bacterium]|nr:dienelactone hydrolase family protein [Candidatus Binatia bacterium]
MTGPLPATLAAWRRRRSAVRKALWTLLGPLPVRPRPVRATTVRRRVTADYVRDDLVLDDGGRGGIPAALVLPHRRPPYPAILWHHSHFGDWTVGLEELFQPWPVRETPAAALARLGYAVLAIDALGFGDRRGTGPGGPRETGRAEETSRCKLLLWQGTSLWAMMVRDDLLALDYLAHRPEIDGRRIGATGMSMGSTRTWWLAALDDRVAVAACVGCLTRGEALVRHRALHRHSLYYYVPGMLRRFDSDAVLGLIAPRALLTLTGDRDRGSPIDGVRFLNRFCARLWALHGHRAAFKGVVYRGIGHVYTAAMWRQVLAWFDAHL